MTQESNVEMVNLEIDGKPVRVPKGTFVFRAAAMAGINIPNFCQYPDLRPFGACRSCMCEIVTRRSNIDISCSTPVSEGMKVFTRSPKVLEAQRFAVEALLVDHPIDCPICDKSGECELQNHAYYTNVRTNNPLARPKNSWEYETLSESVMIKRDRCVLCGRCVRVCDELVGSTALAWANRGNDSYIDAAFGKDLKDSPCVSCGLCIEVCPVGALLNTSYHDTARAWFLKKVKTVCTFCGVGCSMELHVEEETGRIKRIVGTQDTGINNEQLCARGFFGFEFVQRDDRLQAPLVRKDGELVESSWQEALSLVAERLPRYQGDSFAAIAGAHSTNEENYLFGKFVRGVMRSNHIDFDAGMGRGVRPAGLRDVFGSDAPMNGFVDVYENAGCVLLIGSNLSATHPVFTYKLQTAVRRRGSKLIVASPQAVPLSQIATLDIRYREGAEADLLNGLAALIARRELVAHDFLAQRVDGLHEWWQAAQGYTAHGTSANTGVPVEVLEQAAEIYATGGSGVDGRGADGLFPPSAIFYSSALTLRDGGENIDYGAAALALLTGNVGRPGAGVNSLKTANNSQGALDMGCVPFLLPGERPVEDPESRRALQQAWSLPDPLPARPGLGLEGMLDAARSGRVRAMYIMGSNPVEASSNPQRVADALGHLDFLVVQDMFLTQTGRQADVVLPACSWAEKDGTFTSAERRIQRVNKALTNYGQSIPDWTILVHLLERMGFERLYTHSDQILAEIAAVVPSYAGINRRVLERAGNVMTMRPGRVYRNPSLDEIKRLGVQWPTTDADPHGTPVLYADSFPNGKARLVGVPFQAGRLLADGVYRGTIRISLYHQGTGTMTGRCPTLVSLDEGGAADSSPERGRGVGMLRSPNLQQSGYSTGQLTDI
ncbi:MAG: molybdopterin-dependent oxidoreductase [Chloroflexota bacterium]|nr:molybdopterin-dependent oxidoreductase [Chloroflexota bacterium]